ncbi:MAG: PH domain-containing protein [Bacteroides sp.]|nr:PH domain-containing protein [Bacteroides sp.]
MKKFGGTKYKSLWDKTTWLIIGLVLICCVVPCFLDDGIWPTIISLVMLAFVLLTFLGIYYRIDKNKLVVYIFFIPNAYPIDKIKEIKPTKSVISSPATSLTHRLAITFTDRKILKSSTPLIISPVRQDEFISQLISINPNIQL